MSNRYGVRSAEGPPPFGAFASNEEVFGGFSEQVNPAQSSEEDDESADALAGRPGPVFTAGSWGP